VTGYATGEEAYSDVGGSSDLFEVVDAKRRIFARNTAASVPLGFNAHVPNEGHPRPIGREEGPHSAVPAETRGVVTVMFGAVKNLQLGFGSSLAARYNYLG
jgi:hypothetical protein